MAAAPVMVGVGPFEFGSFAFPLTLFGGGVKFEVDFEEDAEGFETDSKGGISSESESG